MMLSALSQREGPYRFGSFAWCAKTRSLSKNQAADPPGRVGHAALCRLAAAPPPAPAAAAAAAAVGSGAAGPDDAGPDPVGPDAGPEAAAGAAGADPAAGAAGADPAAGASPPVVGRCAQHTAPTHSGFERGSAGGAGRRSRLRRRLDVDGNAGSGLANGLTADPGACVPPQTVRYGPSARQAFARGTARQALSRLQACDGLPLRRVAQSISGKSRESRAPKPGGRQRSRAVREPL
jgi:hypothetical protein